MTVALSGSRDGARDAVRSRTRKVQNLDPQQPAQRVGPQRNQDGYEARHLLHKDQGSGSVAHTRRCFDPKIRYFARSTRCSKDDSTASSRENSLRRLTAQ